MLKLTIFFIGLFLVCSLMVFGGVNKIIYETKPEIVPVYIDAIEQNCYIKYFDNVTIDKQIINQKSELVCFNYTKKIISSYKEIQKETNKRIGINKDDKNYINKKGINLIDNTLFEWGVPVGDRNYKQYGSCSITEKNRGVCSEKQI